MCVCLLFPIVFLKCLFLAVLFDLCQLCVFFYSCFNCFHFLSISIVFFLVSLFFLLQMFSFCFLFLVQLFNNIFAFRYFFFLFWKSKKWRMFGKNWHSYISIDFVCSSVNKKSIYNCINFFGGKYRNAVMKRIFQKIYIFLESPIKIMDIKFCDTSYNFCCAKTHFHKIRL